MSQMNRFSSSLALTSITQIWWHQNNRKLRPFSENPRHLQGPAICTALTLCPHFMPNMKNTTTVM